MSEISDPLEYTERLVLNGQYEVYFYRFRNHPQWHIKAISANAGGPNKSNLGELLLEIGNVDIKRRGWHELSFDSVDKGVAFIEKQGI